jgi:hypothetical protein
MLLDYVGIYIFKQLIMCFSKGNFFPERKSYFNSSSLKEYIINFKLNIIESVVSFFILRLIRSLLNHQLDFNDSLLEDKITNSIIALIFEKILKCNALTPNSKGEGEKINLIEVDAQKVGALYTTLPTVVISPFRIVISLYFLFNQFGKKFSYALLILFIVLILILFLQILYLRNYKKLFIIIFELLVGIFIKLVFSEIFE